MIPVEEEAKELHAETGEYECCIFCHKETKFWHTPTNTPVCEKCAEERTIQQLKEARAVEYEN
jgi:hypothetical protein